MEKDVIVEEDSGGDSSKTKLSKHCHCSLFNADDDVISFMADGQPSKRFFKRQELQQQQNIAKEMERELIRDDEKAMEKKDLEREVQVLKNLVTKRKRKELSEQIKDLKKKK